MKTLGLVVVDYEQQMFMYVGMCSEIYHFNKDVQAFCHRK